MAQIVPTTNITLRESWRWIVATIITCLCITGIVVLNMSNNPTHVVSDSTNAQDTSTPTPTPTPSPALESAPPTFVQESLVRIDITWETSLFTFGKGGPAELKAEIETACTGFFYDDDTEESASLATAAHCVDQKLIEQALMAELRSKARTNPMALSAIDRQQPAIIRTVRVSQPLGIANATLSEKPLIAQVIGSSADDDAALLRLNLFSDDVPTLQFADGAPEVGDKVWAYGFAASVAGVADKTRLAPSFKDGIVSSRQVMDPSGAAITEMSANVTNMMSGGVSVDEDGNVIGINSFKVDNQAFNFVTDTEGTRRALAAIAGS